MATPQPAANGSFLVPEKLCWRIFNDKAIEGDFVKASQTKEIGRSAVISTSVIGRDQAALPAALLQEIDDALQRIAKAIERTSFTDSEQPPPNWKILKPLIIEKLGLDTIDSPDRHLAYIREKISGVLSSDAQQKQSG
ncbi:hypothetical protein [Methylocystis sp. Sn-Cys]|uniref:hypothetical protein n=1 Tax=Methylocystis sp. Sn-Cys TaxID=1701263 RepID=UPI001922B970|nr:hypothetical protein [Methylocystis sp. Sn-Cys]MBL1257979.1 hypothetical protein [Methylocystis sp. Sn-Cys]